MSVCIESIVSAVRLTGKWACMHAAPPVQLNISAQYGRTMHPHS